VCFGSFASLLTYHNMSALRPISDLQFEVANTETGLIQAPDRGLETFEWAAIRPFLPNKPRGVPLPRVALCPVSGASEISRPCRDKSTRQANHPELGQARLRKIFCFSEIANQSTYENVSPDERGGSRSSRTCGGMRWTRWRRMTRAARCGRRRRVVLTPRRWCQVRWVQNFRRMTVAKKAGHRGERAISRSTTAQGRPGCLR
jgi:hypothetical protein